jgi:Domain of unknown function (DUF5615)
MRTLSSELGSQVAKTTVVPRMYADANLPAGLVMFMRARLAWDVFFVMEHDDLRRAPDERHYRLAREMHRTLVTLDRDYMDDRRFPPTEGGGVIVLTAPDEPRFENLLRRVDRHLVRPDHPDTLLPPATSFDMPLAGRKIHANSDWP